MPEPAASGLRRTREYTALRALGLGPWRIAVPVLSVAAAVAVAIAVFDDTLVVDASRRVEEIMAVRFQRGGADGLEHLLPGLALDRQPRHALTRRRGAHHAGDTAGDARQRLESGTAYLRARGLESKA